MSSEEMSTMGPVRKDEVIEWLHERQLNAQRIADLKTGEDRNGWLEDVHFFESAITHLKEATND